MEIKRRKVKVKEKYGSHESKEDRTRKSFEHAEEDYRELYKKMSRKEKEKISLPEELYKVRKQAEQVLSSKSLDESDMLTRKSEDRPMSLTQLASYFKKNLHPNICIVVNNSIGENVGGHSVMFAHNELEFICGVGKNMDKVITPETTFQTVYVPEKDDWERKIEARGWLAAVETITAWLKRRGIQARQKNFLN